jgi:hypothetical protein
MNHMLLMYAAQWAWSESERVQCYGGSASFAHPLKSKWQHLAASPLQVSIANSGQSTRRGTPRDRQRLGRESMAPRN